MVHLATSVSGMARCQLLELNFELRVMASVIGWTPDHTLRQLKLRNFTSTPPLLSLISVCLSSCDERATGMGRDTWSQHRQLSAPGPRSLWTVPDPPCNVPPYFLHTLPALGCLDSSAPKGGARLAVRLLACLSAG